MNWVFAGITCLIAVLPLESRENQSREPSAANQAVQVAPARVEYEQAYRLEPGDEIEVRFVYNTDFNERAQIRPDGRVSMPGLGEVVAGGLTVGEFAGRLEAAYQPTLKRPDLTVQVRSFANRKVYVGGEVARPGPLMIMGPKTVAEAIIEAGGMRENAKRSHVILIRRSAAGVPSTQQIAMSQRGRSPNATGFLLQPYDVVLVTESGISKADRAVDQYIRRMIPGLLTGGFTYLLGNAAFVPR